MPDRTPSRLAPDTHQLLRLMAMRSEIVERGLADRPAAGWTEIEELPPAEPSILDQLVQARVGVEEEALAVELPGETLLPESATELEALAADIEPDEEPELDLLELNAGEAGLPAEIAPLEASSEEDAEEEEPALEHEIEGDPLPAEPVIEIEETTVLLADEPAGAEEPEAQEGDAEVDRIEELPPVEESEAFLDAEGPHLASPTAVAEEQLVEGPGEDFQTLLAGTRDGDDLPLLPADADVRLRARNGPKPGAEFVGKSTLAGATGLYCLIERFNLPEGTRVKVTLSAPRFADRFEIQDAIVTRVRRAPANSTEVQLAFDQPHEEFEEFVVRHFGDKPIGFALFSRRRPKR